jgi:ABC-type Fe2+-enterobactin transport system substrate-binding protein
MIHKMVYKGDAPIRLLFPVEQHFENGDKLEVNNKEHAEQLQELGFKLEEVPAKKKTEKEGDE